MQICFIKDGTALTLPVTPAGYAWGVGRNMEAINISQLGDVYRPGGRSRFSGEALECLLYITNARKNTNRMAHELIDRSIAELLSARGLDVASLGQSDRVDVIRHLNGNGVFMLKGAVACAATALGISEPSVYRYLQKVRKEG